MNGLGFFLSKGLFSLFFILSGALKLLAWQETVHELSCSFSHCSLLVKGTLPSWSVCECFASNASTVLAIALFLEIGGALLILTGIRVRMGAFFLLLFMVPFTLVLPAFWWDDGGDKGQHLLDFFKNLSLIGGLLHLLIKPQMHLTSK